MKPLSQAKQLYAGRRTLDGNAAETCLCYADSSQEAFDRLARRMFALRLVERHLCDDPAVALSQEHIQAVLWEKEQFVVFGVVFDPDGIATLQKGDRDGR